MNLECSAAGCVTRSDYSNSLRNICKSIKGQITDLIILQNSIGTVTTRLLWGITCDVVNFVAEMGDSGIDLENETLPHIISTLYSEHQSSMLPTNPFDSKLSLSVQSEVRSLAKCLRVSLRHLSEKSKRSSPARERIDQIMLGNLLNVHRVISAICDLCEFGSCSPRTEVSEPIGISSSYERTINSNHHYGYEDEKDLRKLLSYSLPLTPFMPCNEEGKDDSSVTNLHSQKLENNDTRDVNSLLEITVSERSSASATNIFKDPSHAGILPMQESDINESGAHSKKKITAEEIETPRYEEFSKSVEVPGSNKNCDYSYHKRFKKSRIIPHALGIASIPSIANIIRKRFKLNIGRAAVGCWNDSTNGCESRAAAAEDKESPDIIKLFVPDKTPTNQRRGTIGSAAILRRSSRIFERILNVPVSRLLDVRDGKHDKAVTPLHGIFNKYSDICWCNHREALNNLDISPLSVLGGKTKVSAFQRYPHLVMDKKDIDASINFAECVLASYENKRSEGSKKGLDSMIRTPASPTLIVNLGHEHADRESQTGTQPKCTGATSKLKLGTIMKRMLPVINTPSGCNILLKPIILLSDFAIIVQTSWRVVLAKELVESTKILRGVADGIASSEHDYLQNIVIFHKNYLKPAFTHTTETITLYTETQYAVAHFDEIMASSTALLECLTNTISKWNVTSDISPALLNLSHNIFPYLHFVPNTSTITDIWRCYIDQSYYFKLNVHHNELSRIRMHIPSIFSLPQRRLSSYIFTLEVINSVRPSTASLLALERFKKAEMITKILERRIKVTSYISQMVPKSADVDLRLNYNLLTNVCTAILITSESIKADKPRFTAKTIPGLLKKCLLMSFNGLILVFETGLDCPTIVYEDVCADYLRNTNLSYDHCIHISKIIDIVYFDYTDGAGYVFSITHVTESSTKMQTNIALNRNDESEKFYDFILDSFPSMITKRNPIRTQTLSASCP